MEIAWQFIIYLTFIYLILFTLFTPAAQCPLKIHGKHCKKRSFVPFASHISTVLGLTFMMMYFFSPASQSEVIFLFLFFIPLFSSLPPTHLSKFLLAACLKDGSVLALSHLCVLLFLDHFTAFSII